MVDSGSREPRGRVVVLCPMQIEHKAVARAVRRAGLSGVEVVQTGIGRDAVVRAVEGIKPRPGERARSAGDAVDEAQIGPRTGPLHRDSLGGGVGTLVILAGACGALVHVEDVPRIGSVIDEHGHTWETGDTGVTLIGVDRVVSTPAAKRELAERTGAAIVDMESHAFIAACERSRFAWAVVRGVSDTPDETLPEEVLRWITPGGDTRVGVAVLDMVRKPALVGHIVPVMRRSQRVLPRVGERVVEMVEVVRE